MHWQFQRLTVFVLLLNLFMLLGGLPARQWSMAALAVYLLIWVALLTWTWSIGRWHSGLWRVLWVSLNCGRPAHAVWRTSGLNARTVA